jgi:hypothetical protein
MKPSSESSDEQQPAREPISTALMLIGIGVFLIAAQVFDIGVLVLLGLGAAFTLWGILTRAAGLLIPGGILNGIGLGALTIEQLLPNLDGDAEGGVFLLCFALGWASIALLSAIFTSDRQWWALVPATILALIGGAVLGGGIWARALELASDYWPLVLVVIGAWMLLERGRGETKEE